MTRLAATLGIALIFASSAMNSLAQPVSVGESAPQVDVPALRARMAKLVTDVPGFEMPANRPDLDEALARNDLGKIGTLSKAAGTSLRNALLQTNWERYAVFTGAGFGVGYFYAVNLSNMGLSYDAAARKSPGQADQNRRTGVELKKTAAAMGLYAVALTLVDGERCADPTAPPRHRNDIVATLKDVWSAAALLPMEERDALLGIAVRMERETAPLRASDTWLCAGGEMKDRALMETLAENPASARPAPSVPGLPGKTYDVHVDPAKYPLFVNEDLWPSRQQKMRAELPILLGRIIGLEITLPPR